MGHSTSSGRGGAAGGGNSVSAETIRSAVRNIGTRGLVTNADRDEVANIISRVRPGTSLVLRDDSIGETRETYFTRTENGWEESTVHETRGRYGVRPITEAAIVRRLMAAEVGDNERRLRLER